jgi:SAM-dependent methyltransferase
LQFAAKTHIEGRVGSEKIPSAPPIPAIPVSILGEIRSLFTSAGYAAVLEQYSNSKLEKPGEADPRLGLLKRLFSQAEILTLDEAASGIAPLNLHALIETGLLEQKNDRVRARFQFQVYDGLLFIVDFMPLQHPADIVLPIGPSGKYLASVTIRNPVKAALDLGCGCGIQALLLARHAEHVTATDINPRALALTRLNTVLNGISNIQTLEGSYFEPVHGRTFDLIVANLPYVITPENKHLYRDLGQGDDIPIRKNVQQIPAYLNEGGYAHLMVNWIHRSRESWWQPIDQWIEKCPADAWLFYSSSTGPEEYAKKWILISEKDQPREFETVSKKWVKWYKTHHIERIAFGLITLRRRTGGANWRCFLNVNTILDHQLGAYIQSLFDIQDYLAQFKKLKDLADEKLAQCNVKIEVSPANVCEAQTIKGYLLRKKVTPASGRTINHLDGLRSLGQAIQQSAQDEGLDSDAIQAEVTKEIYQLMNLGMIGPSQDA